MSITWVHMMHSTGAYVLLMRLGRRHHNFEGLGSGWDLDMDAGISFIRVIDGPMMGE